MDTRQAGTHEASMTAVSSLSEVPAENKEIWRNLLMGLLPPVLPGQRWKWVSGSWVTTSEPLTHDDNITAQ